MTINIIAGWQLETFLEKIDHALGIDSTVDNTTIGYYMGVCNIPLTQANVEYLRFILDNIDNYIEVSEEEKL